ncbi:MAG: ribonuclease D [Hydrogenovibrio sp.]
MTHSFILIDTQPTLETFCRRIESERWLAIDTEFVRTDTYFPQLCLIQIQSEGGQAAIIDPLTLSDLSPLWRLLAAPNCIKVFHSARQDLEVLYQLSGALPSPIFDTQIAGVFLGYGDLAGLAKVVKGELGRVLEKDQTRTDWSRRPLSDQQLTYAIDDVRTLAPIYERFLARLTDAEQKALEEDFEALLSESLYRPSPETAGDKLKMAGKLARKNKAIAYRLAEWRELYAINHNKPKRWVLSDDALIDIAKRPPQTPQALYKVPNIKASSVKNFGDEWIALIDEVFAHPEHWPETEPKEPPPSAQEDILLNIAFALLQQTALDYGINPNNIANRTQLLQLIRQPDSGLSGWRHLLLGQPLCRFLQGQSSLSCQSQRIIQKTFMP